MACSCSIVADDGIEVSGNGSLALPYRIKNLRGDALTRLQVIDTNTVDLTLTQVNPGDPNTPVTLQADATMSMQALTDVSHSDIPAAGDVPTWDGTQWVFSPAGSGSGVPPGGTTGQVLTKISNTDGDAGWQTPASGGGLSAAYGAWSRGTVQTLTTAVSTDVVFNTEEQTPVGVSMNMATGVVTVTQAGVYTITGHLQFAQTSAGNNNGTRYGFIYTGPAGNLTNRARFSEAQGPTSYGGVTMALTRYLAAGEQIKVVAYQASGGNLDLYGDSSRGITLEVALVTPVSGVLTGEKNYAIARRHTAATSIPTSTVTTIPWDTAGAPGYDTGDFAFSAGEFTVPVAGYYDVEGVITYAISSTSGGRTVYPFVNGIAQTSFNGSPTSGACAFAATVLCAAGDKISIRTQHSAGAALALSGAVGYNWVNVVKVPGPTVPGSAASGVWGTAPLNVYGADSLVGREVYVDSAGQLRSRPDNLNPGQFTNASPMTAYPFGITMVATGQVDGWPVAASGTVLTVRQRINPDCGYQIWSRNNGNANTAYYIRQASVNGWAAWQQFGTKVQRGVVNMPAVAANGGSSAVVTFPEAFSAPPIVVVSADSNGYGAASSGSVTASGFSAKYYNPTASVPTSPKVYWVAYEA